jgi:hypothetical protein
MIAIRPGFFFDVKFPLGQCLATPGALEALQRSGETPAKFLRKHVAGDWGDVCEDDKAANEASLIDGSRLLSAYRTTKGTKIWIITEAADDEGNRICTTLLKPEEY